MNTLHRNRKFTPGRIAQHVAFWIVVFIAFTFIYAVKSTYWIAFRNNLFYVPIHITYFYALAYWLIPKYLFRGRYASFLALFLVLMLTVTIASRLVDILIANPYLVAKLPNVDWDLTDAVRHQNFWQKLTSVVFFVNAFKMMHFVVGPAIGIKMFKLYYERKQAAVQAELNALKGQVHPHFLFNTLNNLYALTLNNSPKSSQVVLGLSDLLRYMLYECNANEVSLEKEVQMLQQYVALEKLRYEDRIDINFTVTGDLENKLIAPLMMLPFVENAFKHGASDKVGQAWVNIDLNVEADHMRLKVANCKPETLPADSNIHHGHIGLKNVQQRLELIYPSNHQLKIMDDEDVFLVVLDVQLKTVNAPEPHLLPA